MLKYSLIKGRLLGSVWLSSLPNRTQKKENLAVTNSIRFNDSSVTDKSNRTLKEVGRRFIPNKHTTITHPLRKSTVTAMEMSKLRESNAMKRQELYSCLLYTSRCV